MLILRVEVVGWTCELEPPDEEIVMTGVLADMLPATVCLHVSDRDEIIVMSMQMMKEWKGTRLGLGRVETPPPRSRVLHFAHPFHATFLLPSQHHQRNNDKGHALITLPMWMSENKGQLLRMPWMRPILASR